MFTLDFHGINSAFFWQILNPKEMIPELNEIIYLEKKKKYILLCQKVCLFSTDGFQK